MDCVILGYVDITDARLGDLLVRWLIRSKGKMRPERVNSVLGLDQFIPLEVFSRSSAVARYALFGKNALAQCTFNGSCYLGAELDQFTAKGLL